MPRTSEVNELNYVILGNFAEMALCNGEKYCEGLCDYIRDIWSPVCRARWLLRYIWSPFVYPCICMQCRGFGSTVPFPWWLIWGLLKIKPELFGQSVLICGTLEIDQNHLGSMFHNESKFCFQMPMKKNTLSRQRVLIRFLDPSSSRFLSVYGSDCEIVSCLDWHPVMTSCLQRMGTSWVN